MKAKNHNGTIKVYDPLPRTYENIINFHLLSDSDLETHGFYDVHQPTYNIKTKEIGDIEWDADNSRFTYPVVDKTFSKTLTVMKNEKIADLKALYNAELAKTDWYITRKQEKNTAIPSSITTERDNLRSDCATKEAEIKAKTTKAQVADYDLPNL